MKRYAFIPDISKVHSLHPLHIREWHAVKQPGDSHWTVVWLAVRSDSAAELAKLGAVHFPRLDENPAIGAELAATIPAAGLTEKDSVREAARKLHSYHGFPGLDPDI